MIVDHLILAGINILLAWSCYVILLSGQVSIGNSAFMAMGAYVSGILSVKLGFPLIFSLAAGMLFAVIIGVLIGLPAIRTKGVYLVMVTIGVASSVEVLLQNIDYVGGVRGFGVMFGTTLPVVIACVVLLGLILFLISKSPLQLYFEALREDEMVAASLGLNVTYIKLIAFGLGAGLAALGGGLYAHYMSFIAPEHFGVMISIWMLFYVLFGGRNNMWGPILGALIITLLPEYIRSLAEWRITVFSVLIIAILLLRPEGLLTFRTVTVRWGKTRKEQGEKGGDRVYDHTGT